MAHPKAAPVPAVVDLDHVFTYHPAGPEQIACYAAIREAAKGLVQAIVENTPVCPDQSVAIRKVREAVMTANAAVALDGRTI